MSDVREQLRRAEEIAANIRMVFGYGRDEAVDPFDLAERMKITVLRVSEVAQSGLDCSEVSPLDAQSFSGLALQDLQVVVLNDNQTPQRLNSTLAEELVHLFLQHPPTRLSFEAGGLKMERSFDGGVEKDAYWAGASLLLPKLALARGIWRGVTTEQIAVTYGVSSELVSFRLNILGLGKVSFDAIA